MMCVLGELHSNLLLYFYILLYIYILHDICNNLYKYILIDIIYTTYVHIITKCFDLIHTFIKQVEKCPNLTAEKPLVNFSWLLT